VATRFIIQCCTFTKKMPDACFWMLHSKNEVVLILSSIEYPESIP